MPSFTQNARPALIVAGPTASGKSAMALDLAEEFNGWVINCDSMQVYKGLSIVSARPTAEEEKRVPHRLYGFLDPDIACSAGLWVDQAKIEMERCWAAGALPIITGGTGLYIKALCEGLSDLPEIPSAIRDSVREAAKKLGAPALHARLMAIDPVLAARYSENDGQRIARALEVFETTGKPLSVWQEENQPRPAVAANYLTLAIVPPRDILYARCNQRFDWMVENGALAEIEAFAALGLDPTLPSMKALGVPELLSVIRGECDLESAGLAAKQATRRFAKRQCTWFRNQFQSATVFPEQYSESLRVKIFTFVRQFLLTEAP